MNEEDTDQREQEPEKEEQEVHYYSLFWLWYANGGILSDAWKDRP